MIVIVLNNPPRKKILSFTPSTMLLALHPSIDMVLPVKQGAFSSCSSSLCYFMRKLDEMTTGKLYRVVLVCIVDIKIIFYSRYTKLYSTLVYNPQAIAMLPLFLVYSLYDILYIDCISRISAEYLQPIDRLQGKVLYSLVGKYSTTTHYTLSIDCTQSIAQQTKLVRVFPPTKTLIRDFEVGPVEYMTASLMISGLVEMILVSWEKSLGPINAKPRLGQP